MTSGAPGRDSGDAAVLEARIAVAYSYAELGAYGLSLERYQDAIGAFDREHVALDESIGAIRKGKLLDGLLEKNPGEEMGWFWNIQELPEMPHASHLNQVLAQHEFQEAFKNWRDLRFLSKNLQGWADTLGIYNDMLSNRRQAYADRLPKVRDDAGKLNIAEATKRRDALASELDKAEVDADHAALADAVRRAQIERVADMQALLQRAGADPEVAAAADRVRRVAGALTWQLAQEFPDRLWNAKKALRSINMEIRTGAGARCRAGAGPARRAGAPRGVRPTHCHARRHDPRADPESGRDHQRTTGPGAGTRRGRAHAPEGAPGGLHHAGTLCRGPTL